LRRAVQVYRTLDVRGWGEGEGAGWGKGGMHIQIYNAYTVPCRVFTPTLSALKQTTGEE